AAQLFRPGPCLKSQAPVHPRRAVLRRANLTLLSYHPIMEPLVGKVALVTGASRGIGRAVAVALAAAGADVAVNYQHRAEDAAAVVKEIEALGRRASAIQADVSQSSEVARMVESAQTALGPI